MRDESDEEFGLKRLAQTVQDHCKESASEIVTAVNQAVDRFIGRVSPHDDRTLILIKMGQVIS